MLVLGQFNLPGVSRGTPQDEKADQRVSFVAGYPVDVPNMCTSMSRELKECFCQKELGPIFRSLGLQLRVAVLLVGST